MFELSWMQGTEGILDLSMEVDWEGTQLWGKRPQNQGSQLVPKARDSQLEGPSNGAR